MVQNRELVSKSIRNSNDTAKNSTEIHRRRWTISRIWRRFELVPKNMFFLDVMSTKNASTAHFQSENNERYLPIAGGFFNAACL